MSSELISNLRIIRDTLVRAPYWQLGRGPERAGRYLVFCCLTVACLIAMLLRASEDGEWTFWVSNFIFLGVFLNYLVLLRERRDVFEPVVLVAAMLALGFACRGIFLHLAFDSARVNPWVSANLDLLGRMSVYTTGGFALFLLAYYLPIGPLLVSRIPRMRTAWNMASLGPKAIRIYLLCLPAKLMTVIPQGAFPLQDQLMRYLGNVIGLVASLADVALILYGIYYYHRRCEGRRGRMPFYAISGASAYLADGAAIRKALRAQTTEARLRVGHVLDPDVRGYPGQPGISPSNAR